jgi:hypothetical protein
MSKNAQKILLILSLVLILSVTLASFGIAYAGGIRGMGLLGVSFLFTCAIIIVLAQLIPAGILISAFIGAIFSSLRKGEIPIRVS